MTSTDRTPEVVDGTPGALIVPAESGHGRPNTRRTITRTSLRSAFSVSRRLQRAQNGDRGANPAGPSGERRESSSVDRPAAMLSIA